MIVNARDKIPTPRGSGDYTQGSSSIVSLRRSAVDPPCHQLRDNRASGYQQSGEAEHDQSPQIRRGLGNIQVLDEMVQSGQELESKRRTVEQAIGAENGCQAKDERRHKGEGVCSPAGRMLTARD